MPRFPLISVLLFLLPFIAPAPGLADETLFTNTLVDLSNAAAGGDLIASLSPGVPVTVLAEKGARLKVAITGWSPEGGEKYLFTKMGQRIRLATLSDTGQRTRAIVATKLDYYDSTWQDVRLTGWIDKTTTAANVTDVWQTASALFHQRCTRCHALHRPTEFKANQWPSILKIMTVRAGLSKGDKALVTQFLQTYAKDQKNPPPLPEVKAPPADLPAVVHIAGDAALAAKGGALFAADSCNACHGDDGATPVLPAYPRLAGQNADYLFKQLDDFKKGTRSNDADSVMRGIVGDIAGADLRAISYWLSGLK